MSEGERMPKVDLKKDQPLINKSIVDYMKLVERENLERVEKLRRIRRNNIVTGLALGAGVFSIYAYSIFAVKQETFLDDFNEPEKIEPPPLK